MATNLGLVIKEWNKAIIAPSYSTSLPLAKVIGLKDFHNIFSQILVAINNDIPEPIPYPF